MQSFEFLFRDQIDYVCVCACAGSAYASTMRKIRTQSPEQQTNKLHLTKLDCHKVSQPTN